MILTTTFLKNAAPALACGSLFSVIVACGGPKVGGPDGGGVTDGGFIDIPTVTCDNPTKATTTQCRRTTGTPLLAASASSAAIIHNGFAYVLGGTQVSSGAQGTTDVLVASVMTGDVLGTWTKTAALPQAVAQGAVAASGNFLYFVGGLIPSSTKGTVQSKVYIGAVDSSGLVSSWTAGPDLPEARAGGAAVVVNHSLYVLGGYAADGQVASSAASHVYRANIMSDGTLGAWEQDTSLPGGRSFFSAVAHGEHIYVVGGAYLSSAGLCEPSKVLVGFLNSDGTISGWGQASSFAQDVRSGAAVVVGDTLVVGGGYVQASNVSSSSVVAAPINSDGSVGAWREIGQLPGKVNSLTAASTDTSAFFFGGIVSGQPAPNSTVFSVAGGTSLCSQ